MLRAEFVVWKGSASRHVDDFYIAFTFLKFTQSRGLVYGIGTSDLLRLKAGETSRRWESDTFKAWWIT